MAIRRKTASSMVVAMMQLKNGEAQATVSAGSTGAWLAGGIFKVGRIKGIDRPALAPALPTMAGTPAFCWIAAPTWTASPIICASLQ